MDGFVDELKALMSGNTSLDELFMSFPTTFTLYKHLAVAICFVSHEFLTSGPKHFRLILSKHCQDHPWTLGLKEILEAV